jgi:hypothetical protein
VNTARAILDRLRSDTEVMGLVAQWRGGPSIHTRRPVPSDATYPMLVVAPEAAISDEDGLTNDRPVIVRDVVAYGHQPDQLRDVERLGYAVRRLFHRVDRHLFPVSGYNVLDVVAQGPTSAPTDDETKAGRRVQLTIRLHRQEDQS